MSSCPPATVQLLKMHGCSHEAVAPNGLCIFLHHQSCVGNSALRRDHVQRETAIFWESIFYFSQKFTQNIVHGWRTFFDVILLETEVG